MKQQKDISGSLKMKLYSYRIECTGTITGHDKEDAQKALVDWLNTYVSDFKVSNFQEVGDAW